MQGQGTGASQPDSEGHMEPPLAQGSVQGPPDALFYVQVLRDERQHLFDKHVWVCWASV